MHDNQTVMDNDILGSKFPYLEGHRKETALGERPGNALFIATPFNSMRRLI